MKYAVAFQYKPSSQFRCSIVVSISACHVEDPGSIPGGGDLDIYIINQSQCRTRLRKNTERFTSVTSIMGFNTVQEMAWFLVALRIFCTMPALRPLMEARWTRQSQRRIRCLV